MISKLTMNMKPHHIAALIVATACTVSCASNDDLQKRMDQRNANYSSFTERREIRTDARQERTDMWFDSKMH
jgi:hypothetical protein